jgi:DNA polymerase
MLVGEGPGEQEKKPFTGTAGDFLRKILVEIGFSDLEQNFFVTNIVRHRAYKLNSKGHKRNRPPSVQQITACRHFLIKEIEIVQPKLIITLGATAAKWFLGRNFKLTKNRGKVFLWRGIPVLPTFHPSAVRRGFKRELGLKLFKKDLSLAASLVNSPN